MFDCAEQMHLGYSKASKSVRATYVYVCAYIYIYMYVCMYVCMYIYIYIYYLKFVFPNCIYLLFTFPVLGHGWGWGSA